MSVTTFLLNQNFAFSTLANPTISGATTFTVVGGQGARFPTLGNYVCVLWSQSFSTPSQDPDREIIEVTARVSDILTATRAQEGTIQKGWIAGDNIALVITAGKVTELETAINLRYGSGDSPNFNVINESSLTALRLVASDGSNNLVSIASPANVNMVLHDGAPPSFSYVVEGDISLSNGSTVNDATTAHHGFLPQLTGNATQFLNGVGVFTTTLAGAASGYLAQSFVGQTSVTVTHNLNGYPLVQVIGTTNSYTVTHNSVNDFTVAFDVASTGTIILTLGSPGEPQVGAFATDHTMTDSDGTIIADGTINVNLLTAIGRAGRTLTIIRRYGGGPTTINSASSQTFSGQATPLILNSQWDSVTIQSDGSNWLII